MSLSCVLLPNDSDAIALPVSWQSPWPLAPRSYDPYFQTKRLILIWRSFSDGPTYLAGLELVCVGMRMAGSPTHDRAAAIMAVDALSVGRYSPMSWRERFRFVRRSQRLARTPSGFSLSCGRSTRLILASMRVGRPDARAAASAFSKSC